MNINFTLSDIVGRKALNNVRQYAAHPRKAVQGILFTLDRKIRDTFQQQKDPWGRPWQPLKEQTLAARRRKNNFRTSILVATAEMFRSLKRVVGDDNEGYISIGTDERPVTPHQFGAPEINLAARPMMPFRPENNLDMPSQWDEDIWSVINESLPEEMR